MNRIVSFYFWLLLSFAPMCVINNDFVQKAIANLNYRGKYSADIKNYEIVFPQRVNADGSFISHQIIHHHSKRSTKEQDFIFYKIPISGKDYLIELTPNRKLISPGAVVEIHSDDVRQSKKRKYSNESENIKKIFDSVNIKKLKNTECHFYGRVKGENISKAALSTCHGLAGFIQIKKGFYTIEPVAEHNYSIENAYPHILYEADGLENSSVCQTVGELSSSITEQIIRKRRDSNFAISVPMYIETLIVMDKTMVSHHEDSDCENYVLTVFNMAFNLFHDASLGLMMTLTIVRMIRLEIEDDEMNINVNADAEKTLQYFQVWQNQINPGDDSHPNHHDIAVLLTRVNVCYSPSNCGLLGLSTIGKACDPQSSAALCEDNGLRLGFVIAHEIGHLLGADHDSANSTCNGTNAEGKKTVMNPQVSTTAQTWSTCSRGFFTAFFENGLGTCLLDEPEEHHFNVQDLLPGVMYNGDYQCKQLITSDARECEIGSTCESLNCYVPGYACVITKKPPVDGTGCGENMWCHNSKCIVVGERPGAVDGNWGEWSIWSECSRTCGSGVSSSVRTCDRPVPSNGGKSCVGERKRYKICAATFDISEEVNVSFVGKPCETGRPSFRDIQCGEFNDWVYPEDRTTHTWKAYYLHNDNPCALYCISENKQIAALKPRVVDGTMCYKGIRDICVSGKCKTLPCDLHFDSNAIEDACGVCHGDGTACEFSEGVETLSKLPKGLTKLVNIPSGTRNIKVEETLPSLSRIIVRDKDTKDVYVKGILGLFSVPGSQAWLGMIRKNQEALNIPGPVSKPLAIWILRLENVTVKWSMALPVEQQRKPEFAWDFLKWGPCSAKCGPGTQKSDPSCMEEKAGLVEDTYCADLEMPASKVRPCQITPCEPRWMIGDWRGCESNSVVKERKRFVFCVKQVGEGEGESQIVDDSFCTEPKPHDFETCENRQKREDSEYNKESSHNIWEFGSLKSESADFGFHKKYDDYLTHFAALSVPQRESETIPLHLVFSPHFKHYFRVLEESEGQGDSSVEENESLNVITNNRASKAQSKISPDFYKATFSGQQIDVSHIQSKVPFDDDYNSLELKDVKRKKKTPDETINRTPEVLKKKNPRHLLNYPNYKKRIQESKFERQNAVIRRAKKRFINKIRNGRLKCRRQKHRVVHKKDAAHSGHKPEFLPSLKKTRSYRGKLHLHNKKKKFNYTSPNLLNVIENLSDNDYDTKNRYLKLLYGGRGRSISDIGERRRLREFRVNFDASNKIHRITNLLKPFAHFAVPPIEEEKKQKIQKENLKKGETVLNFQRPVQFKDFDGSGLKKLNEKVELNTELKGESKIKNSKIQRLSSHENNCVSNPFDPLHVTKFAKKSVFKMKNLENEGRLCNKPFQKFFKEKLRRKNSIFFCPRRELKHNRDKNSITKRFHSTIKRKRSSKKWRKPMKINKELGNTNIGIERKNYLNNLFRDIHPKVKQESVLSPNVKPLINIGQVVVDKDAIEDQQLDILFQENEGDEPSPKYTQLPRPPLNEKKITLRGQAVFDFFKNLEPRNDREQFYKSTDAVEDKCCKTETTSTTEERKNCKTETTTTADERKNCKTETTTTADERKKCKTETTTTADEKKNCKTESTTTADKKKNCKTETTTTADERKKCKTSVTPAIDLLVGIEPRNDREQFYRSTGVDEKSAKTETAIQEGKRDNLTAEVKTLTLKPPEVTTSSTTTTTTMLTTTYNINNIHNKTIPSDRSFGSSSTPSGMSSGTKTNPEGPTTPPLTAKDSEVKKNETCEEVTEEPCADLEVEEVKPPKKCEPKCKKKKKEKKKKPKKKQKCDSDEDEPQEQNHHKKREHQIFQVKQRQESKFRNLFKNLK